MKSLILAILLSLFFAATAFAWALSWDVSEGATGYKVFYNVVEPPGEVAAVDVGNTTEHPLVGLEVGVRYEFWCTAYNSTGESTKSDSLRWTYPREPIVVEMLDAPVHITINP